MNEKRPSCAAKDEHPAWGRFWHGDERPGEVHSSITCDATSSEWEKRLREFEDNQNPLCLCKAAAVEIGVIW